MYILNKIFQHSINYSPTTSSSHGKWPNYNCQIPLGQTVLQLLKIIYLELLFCSTTAQLWIIFFSGKFYDNPHGKINLVFIGQIIWESEETHPFNILDSKGLQYLVCDCSSWKFTFLIYTPVINNECSPIKHIIKK